MADTAQQNLDAIHACIADDSPDCAKRMVGQSIRRSRQTAVFPLSRWTGQRTCITVVMLALAAACPSGCRTVPPPPVTERHLLDGFEDGRQWSLDSADNYGLVRYSDRHATEGRLAMDLVCFDNGRDKSLFRREADVDLGGARGLWLDVFNGSPDPGVRVALGFMTANGGFFETKAVELAPGRTADLAFDLGEAGWKDAGRARAWAATCGEVTRLMILAYPGGKSGMTLSVDNLRVDTPGADRSPRPVIVGLPEVPARQPVNGMVEMAVTCRVSSLLSFAEKGEAHLPALRPLDLEARLIRPDGERLTVAGFLKSRDDAADSAVWAVRFAPDAAGPWHWDLGYAVRGRWESLSSGTLSCGPDTAGPGVIRLSLPDRMRFCFADGRVFRPLGQNVCWAADYTPYLDAIKAYGGNFVRVWLCPWNNPLLVPPASETVDLASAAAVDEILGLAAARGIHVQLVFAYHGWLDADWDRNPLNSKHGGPCAQKRDFWVDPAARAVFRRYVEYAVRRWSACPALFAWELFNEAGLAPRYEDEDIVKWHRDMVQFTSRVDPARHLVTTSLGVDRGPLLKIWELPGVDFVSEHAYGVNAASVAGSAADLGMRLGKPWWVQEVGRGWTAAADQADPEGRHLHHTLWLSWMTTAAGTALPWWWDTHIEMNGLYDHFRALAAYAAETERDADLRAWSCPVRMNSGQVAEAQGLVGRERCYGFVYGPLPARDPGAAPSAVLPESGRRVVVNGLMDGEYAVEFWETYSGKVSGRGRLVCEAGRLAVELPASNRDFAFKAVRAKPSAPVVTVE